MKIMKTLSKSDYMLFLKHPAWLWLKKYDKSKLPEIGEGLQARFDEGNLFESYAEKLFPNAVKLGYKTDGDFDGNKYNALPSLTKKEIEKGTGVILQGRFEIDGLTFIFDVLERVGDKTFDLYEIKSSTSEKPEHIPDLAFQTIVTEKMGITIRNLYVLHVNNEYVRKGDIDPKKITSKKDVTEDVRECIPETLSNIEKAFKVVSLSNMPDTSPRYLNQGSMDEWLEVFRLINVDLPEYSIYDLCGLTAKKAGLLEDMGVELMKDIPVDFELTDRQLQQIMAIKTGKQHIDKNEIKNFLDKFEYPLHFFDYETFSGVIPAFDGIKPYQQVPFQYSLHILEKPDGELVHKEYLHTENSDPTLLIVQQMQKDFEGKGTILCWHDSFEKARNNELAEMHPEYKAFLFNLNDRIIDLKIPFSKGYFVDKDFFGSASLKTVAPVLVKKPSYTDLEINNGVLAQGIWMETILNGGNKETKNEIISDLRKYCTLDTFIMVKILDKLYNL